MGPFISQTFRCVFVLGVEEEIKGSLSFRCRGRLALKKKPKKSNLFFLSLSYLPGLQGAERAAHLPSLVVLDDEVDRAHVPGEVDGGVRS